MNPLNMFQLRGREGGGVASFLLKGVFAKNERGYRLNAIKKALLIVPNLTSICCVYKEKIVKDVVNKTTRSI